MTRAQTCAEVQRHAIAELCGILGGVFGALIIDEDHHPSRPGRLTRVVSDAPESDTAIGDMVHAHVNQGPIVDPACAKIREYRGLVVSGTRQDFVDDRTWYRDPFVAELRRRAHVDHALIAKRATHHARRIYGVCVNRGWNDAPFIEEDRNLIHLFQLEAEWIHRLADAADAGEELPPRARLSLRELPGANGKKIANLIGGHVVHDHAGAIHRPRSMELFSKREREVVRLACLGKENKLIAYELGLAHSTVKTLLARAARKLGVRTRSALLSCAAKDALGEGHLTGLSDP